MFGKRFIVPVSIICMISLLVGCSVSKEAVVVKEAQQPKIEIPQGSITFKVASSRTKQSFEEITKSIRAKYPNVTLEFMSNYKLDEKTLANLIATGDVPDIFDVATTHIPVLLDFDFPLELDSIIKKYNVNLCHIDQQALGDIRSYNGKQLMIPMNLTPPTAVSTIWGYQRVLTPTIW